PAGQRIFIPAMTNPENSSTDQDVAGDTSSRSTEETSAADVSAEQRLAELEARHAEVSEAFLRAKAEAENTRRRAEEEMAKARKFAIEGFADSLLPVKDSLEAAI